MNGFWCLEVRRIKWQEQICCILTACSVDPPLCPVFICMCVACVVQVT